MRNNNESTIMGDEQVQKILCLGTGRQDNLRLLIRFAEEELKLEGSIKTQKALDSILYLKIDTVYNALVLSRLSISMQGPEKDSMYIHLIPVKPVPNLNELELPKSIDIFITDVMLTSSDVFIKMDTGINDYEKFQLNKEEMSKAYMIYNHTIEYINWVVNVVKGQLHIPRSVMLTEYKDIIHDIDNQFSPMTMIDTWVNKTLKYNTTARPVKFHNVPYVYANGSFMAETIDVLNVLDDFVCNKHIRHGYDIVEARMKRTRIASSKAGVTPMIFTHDTDVEYDNIYDIIYSMVNEYGCGLFKSHRSISKEVKDLLVYIFPAVVGDANADS